MALSFQTVDSPLDGSVNGVDSLIWLPSYSWFVAGCDRNVSGNVILTSPDGIVWTTRTSSGIGRAAYALAYSPSLDRLVAGGYDQNISTRTVITSDDGGETWTNRTGPFTGTSGSITGLAWSPYLSVFVAVGNKGTSGKVVAWSSDGITWHEVSTTYDNRSAFTVQWVDRLSEFWVWGTDGGGFANKPLLTSTDGVNWSANATTGDFVTNASLYGEAWNPRSQVFVGATNNGEPVADPGGTGVATTTDGIAWTALPTLWGDVANPAYALGGTARNPSTGTQVVSGYSNDNSIIAIVNYGDLDVPWQAVFSNAGGNESLNQIYATAFAPEIRTWVVGGVTNAARVIAYSLEEPVTQYQRLYGWRANISDDALETVDVLTSPQGFTA